MFVIVGVIAVIIAWRKGHTTFATVIGIWTVLALVLTFTAGPEYGIGPGALFLIIAICMKKVEPGAKGGSGQNAAAQEGEYCCTACGYRSGGQYQLCPKCGASGTMQRLQPPVPVQPPVNPPVQAQLPLQPEVRTPPVAKTAQEEYYIHWISGPLVGQQAALQGEMTIGRAPDNTVVLPASTPGVSGSHCAVTVSGGQIYVMDLGSTYGTFGNEVHRLPANQPVVISAGDRISLGSGEVTFLISK